MSKRPRSGAGSPTRRSANQVSAAPARNASWRWSTSTTHSSRGARPRASNPSDGRVVIAEQQHAAALELVVLVQEAHAGQHGLGRGLDVIEVRERRRDVREPLAQALQRPVLAWSRARRKRTVRGQDPLDLAQGHPCARDDLRRLQAGERRHRPDAAPVQRRRLEQPVDQRRTVIFFVAVVFCLACVSEIVAVYFPAFSEFPDISARFTLLPGRIRIGWTEHVLGAERALELDAAAHRVQRVAGVADRERQRPGRALADDLRRADLDRGLGGRAARSAVS